MEEPSSVGVSNNGDSGNTSRPTGSIAASDEDASVDDPPGIPRGAGKATDLTEKLGGNAREDINPNYRESDADSIHTRAHVLPHVAVAEGLNTNAQ